MTINWISFCHIRFLLLRLKRRILSLDRNEGAFRDCFVPSTWLEFAKDRNVDFRVFSRNAETSLVSASLPSSLPRSFRSERWSRRVIGMVMKSVRSILLPWPRAKRTAAQPCANCDRRTITFYRDAIRFRENFTRIYSISATDHLRRIDKSRELNTIFLVIIFVIWSCHVFF